MSVDEKYTIDPYSYAVNFGTMGLIVGDWIDLITGDIIVGPYCEWPKREPRYFRVILCKNIG